MASTKALYELLESDAQEEVYGGFAVSNLKGNFEAGGIPIAVPSLVLPRICR